MSDKQFGRVLLFAFVIWVAARSEAQQYSMKALHVGPPTSVYYNYTTPKINNSGQVVGNGRAGAYLYSAGSLTTLPMNALDINNNGAIAMFSNGFSFISFPPYTTQTSMGTLPSCLLGDTVATSLNDSGAAVGVADAPTSCPLPFFSFKGQMAAIGPSQPEARWMATNNSNQVVGYWQDFSTSADSIRAVQLINGTLTDLDPSNANAYDSEAIAINDAGQFIVNSNEAFCTKRLGPPSFKTITYVCRGAWFPVLHSGSTVTTLPVLGPYGGTASAIDFWGDIVGTSQTSTGAQHGFINLYGSTFDLNAQPLTNGAGWTILQAYDINDNGQIVALGSDANGNQDVVVLSPQIVKQPPPVGLSVNRPTQQAAATVVSNASVGTVTLSSAAPFGGTIVYLSSSNPLVKVPPMIRVAPKSKTGTFKITTSAPTGSAETTIFATTGITAKAATFTVTNGGY